MSTALYSHPVCVEHDPGTHHPERPDRLRAVLKALEAEAFDDLVRIPAPKASLAQIERVHAPYYVEKVFENIPESGLFHLDPDTAMSPKSGEAALRAAGGVCAAVDAVIGGQTTNAFCALRPPGHHAEPSQAMGFCLFNNIAIGALQARDAHGIERVAVVDFDVHHGNGTQAKFWDNADLFYASTHQSPLYPGTGDRSERGIYGNIVNVPLAPNSGSVDFREAMTGEILPALHAFGPDFILISAGFDAHVDDPLAGLRFIDDDFEWATAEIAHVARDICQSRIVSTLEGGYDLSALERCAAAHVRALMAA